MSATDAAPDHRPGVGRVSREVVIAGAVRVGLMLAIALARRSS